MADAHQFLYVLAIVLCVAAVTTVAFQRLRQPVVLGYMLAGLIVGPHVPVPLVADPEIVRAVSELGVILLMFSLGLEFSLGKLLHVGAAAAITVIVECSLMFWLGFTAAQILGWNLTESLFTGAIVAISSTTIIAKTFDEQHVSGKGRELVVGFLIVEDLVAVLLMAILTAVSSGSGLSAAKLAQTTGRLAAFLVGIVVVGMLVVPRTVRLVLRLGRAETTLVAMVGICFATALLAQRLGYSVALGAFIAGSLVAEAGDVRPIERLVEPVRDMFTAIFFVSVGMLIDPALIREHWVAVVVLTTVVVLGKTAGVSIGAFLTGSGTRTAVRSGMSMAQIGEFSFIIAALGQALKVTGDFLYPVAVAVSVITTLSTPWSIRASGPVASWVDRKLPRPLQTFAALYGSWVESLRRPSSRPTWTGTRRLVALLLVDAGTVAVIIVAASLARFRIVAWLGERAGLTESRAGVVVLVAAGLLTAPFAFGIVRVVRRLGLLIAEAALPHAGAGQADLADAPRRALIVTLQLGGLLLVGAPLLAVTQPFLPTWHGIAVLALLALLLAPVFWRSTVNLQGHVRAGAQVVVEVLRSQRRAPGSREKDALAEFEKVLPGLGEIAPLLVEARSAAAGRTLAEIDLRGVTGATVLAILRDGQGIIVPTAKEALQPGDILALTGSHEAVEAATSIVERKLL